ncbi:MAG: 50S ribosomal protein P1 [Thaumarchaeota archaeon]|nr:50S ribosomal protein P1 [Nitrososphaerota archaeon]MBI3641928.1 50S ribosomal protein P1 [Nitrososphaerota archaeon]
MEYVYAALLLHKQKKEINEANITSVIKASGAAVNDAQVKALVAALADVNIDEAIKAAPVAIAAAPAAAASGGKEEKKEVETPSAKTEEQAMEGLSALFG